MSSNNSEINSQEYVLLCDQLKTMNEKREKEVLEIKQQLLTYKKFAITCYGLTRIIANLIEEITDNLQINSIIDCFRNFASEFIDEQILSFTENHY
tara:strand:+ start:3499 stop:3786 length:288 start_codon:yes stop_codon:yes gene_type:complete